ncbi:MAG TPA: circadian clock KaiB family protein [Phycisphaerae bacterium]|jgi:circadian clock protein KaiB|nr:circadian clock KaiB family protein [Phycisphaerae bacterium]
MPKARPTRRTPASKTRTARTPLTRFSGTRAFERAIKNADTSANYVLRLYVTGNSLRSQTAISNIRRLCETHLKGRYDLEVIDIYQQPSLAQNEQIIAAPTLIKKLPTPFRKIVGDLSNAHWVLLGLDIPDKENKKNGEERTP